MTGAGGEQVGDAVLKFFRSPSNFRSFVVREPSTNERKFEGERSEPEKMKYNITHLLPACSSHRGSF